MKAKKPAYLQKQNNYGLPTFQIKDANTHTVIDHNIQTVPSAKKIASNLGYTIINIKG